MKTLSLKHDHRNTMWLKLFQVLFTQDWCKNTEWLSEIGWYDSDWHKYCLREVTIKNKTCMRKLGLVWESLWL